MECILRPHVRAQYRPRRHPVPRRAFFSYYHDGDSHRAALVRNMGIAVGNKPVSDNDWEEIKRGGDAAIKRWIDAQFKGKSCVIVLIGEHTSERKWVKYEIQKAINEKKTLIGIHIHNLKDMQGRQSRKGKNPFDDIRINGRRLSNIVTTYDPPLSDSKSTYNYISKNLAQWVEEAKITQLESFRSLRSMEKPIIREKGPRLRNPLRIREPRIRGC